MFLLLVNLIVDMMRPDWDCFTYVGDLQELGKLSATIPSLSSSLDLGEPYDLPGSQLYAA